MGRILGGLALLVGFVTGLGTIVGWVASDSFSDSFRTVTVYVPIVYLAVAVYLLVVWALRLNDDRTGRAVLAGIATFLLAALVALVLTWDETLLFRFGWAVEISAVVIGLSWGRWRYTVYVASHKTCPDCAETIKHAARVCRYCGHRYGGSPVTPRLPRWP